MRACHGICLILIVLYMVYEYKYSHKTRKTYLVRLKFTFAHELHDGLSALPTHASGRVDELRGVHSQLLQRAHLADLQGQIHVCV